MAQDRLTEGALLFPGMPTPVDHAPPGGYQILRAIDSGGFGITYEAIKRDGGDPSLDVTANLWLPPHKPIVVKEYFPDFASRRGRTISVEGEDDSHEETFDRALQRFQREAERLCYLTCLRALRGAREALNESSGSLRQKVEREIDGGVADPSRAMQLVGRLVGDARLAAQQALSTSTLPIVYDFFAADNNAYYVMEYLGGGTLKARLNEDRRNSGTQRVEIGGSSFQLRRPWDPDRLRRFAAAALDALEELHNGIPGQQLVHCDLKPGNIMFRSPDSDDPVLIDFGLARNVNDGKSRSLVAGTLGFAPLEIDPHLRAHYNDERFGGGNVGPWTDIYSLAAILRMLATGVEGSRLPSVFERIRTGQGEIDPVDRLPPFPEGFPQAIERGIRHGMGLHNRERPQSVAEWRKELGLTASPGPTSNGWTPRRTWGAEAVPPPPGSSRQAGPQPLLDKPSTPPARPPEPRRPDPIEAETLVDVSIPRRAAPGHERPSADVRQPERSQPHAPAPPPPPYERPSEPRPHDPRAHDSRGQDPRDQDPRGRDPRGRDPRGPDLSERRRSLDIGAVIGGSFGVIGRNLPACLLFALLLGGIPSAILNIFTSAQSSEAMEAPRLMAIGVSWLVYLIASAFLQATLVRITVAGLRGEKEGIGDLFSAGLAIMVPLIGLSVLTTIVYMLGLLLLIVPGVIMMCVWIVAVPVLVIEGVSVTTALDRSRVLTRGSRWPIFALLVIYWVGAILLGALASLPSIAQLSGLAIFGVNMITSTIIAMVGNAAIATAYVQLRTSLEGPATDHLTEAFR